MAWAVFSYRTFKLHDSLGISGKLATLFYIQASRSLAAKRSFRRITADALCLHTGICDLIDRRFPVRNSVCLSSQVTWCITVNSVFDTLDHTVCPKIDKNNFLNHYDELTRTI